MAKFCGECGFKCDDDAKICSNCGKPLNAGDISSVAVSEPSPDAQVKAPDKKGKKLLIGLIVGIGGGSFLIVLAIALIIFFAQFGGVKGVVRDVVKAYEKDDVTYITSQASSLIKEEMSNLDIYGTSDVFEDDLDYFTEFMEDELYSGYKLTYSISSQYDVSGEEYDELVEEFEDNYIDMEDYFTEIRIVYLDVAVTNNYATENVDMKIYLTKEGLSWKVLYIDTYGYYYDDDYSDYWY